MTRYLLTFVVIGVSLGGLWVSHSRADRLREQVRLAKQECTASQVFQVYRSDLYALRLSRSNRLISPYKWQVRRRFNDAVGAKYRDSRRTYHYDELYYGRTLVARLRYISVFEPTSGFGIAPISGRMVFSCGDILGSLYSRAIEEMRQ